MPRPSSRVSLKNIRKEVYNNLGLSHYQLAMKVLSECNELLPCTSSSRWCLILKQRPNDSGKLRPAKTPPAFRTNHTSPTCKRPSGFFEEAGKKETTYLPARINLSTALIMSGDYAKAISVADETLKVDPNSPEALNNKAVAEYLFGKKNKAENPNALAMLKSISAQAGEAPHPAPGSGAEVDRLALPDRSAAVQADKTVAPIQHRAAENRGLIGAGLTVDPVNFSLGRRLCGGRPNMPDSSFLRPGYVYTYAIHGLVRFGKIAGMTPYVDLVF